MAVNRGVVIINRGLESRTTKSGKRRHTIRIEAAPVAIDVDPKRLGKPVADGIANHLREAVKNISEVAAPATLATRKREEKAFNEGKPWATRRFSGGRIGATAPNQTDRKFNNSGRFAQSIVANGSSDGAWRVNVAANRLDSTTAGAAGLERIWAELIRLVPEFADIGIAFESNTILRKTFERVNRERIQTGKVSTKEMTYFQAFSMLHLKTGTDG